MSRQRIDYLLFGLAWVMALLSGAIVILIGFFLLVESIPALSHIGILRFFTDQSWHPSIDLTRGGGYNLMPMLIGSLVAMSGAIILATPIGVLSALFCHFYAPPSIANMYGQVIEVLAGIPSVIYGFLGLVTLVPIIQHLEPPGQSLLAGILILTMMIIPTVALLADAAMANIPVFHLLGAASLGLSRLTTLRAVVIPLSKSGIMTAIILAAGRAIGETMAILMVCGNIVQIPKTVFDPIRTLTSNIALEMAYAMGNHRSSLFVNGLLLISMVTALVISTQWISKEKSMTN